MHMLWIDATSWRIEWRDAQNDAKTLTAMHILQHHTPQRMNLILIIIRNNFYFIYIGITCCRTLANKCLSNKNPINSAAYKIIEKSLKIIFNKNKDIPRQSLIINDLAMKYKIQSAKYLILLNPYLLSHWFICSFTLFSASCPIEPWKAWCIGLPKGQHDLRVSRYWLANRYVQPATVSLDYKRLD